MKMKKKILTAAVLAAMGAGAAQAVNVSTDGTGQVMLFPYYTVQGNEETYLQVVNTTGNGKAVKIRFREAYNSKEVLDFNIYLSAYDVWTGAVVDSGQGAGVVTYDNTCTVPSLGNGVVQPFRTSLFTDTNGTDAALTGVERTREGYVEIIEMAVIDETPGVVGPPVGPLNDGSVIDGDNDGHADFVHIAGVPENCQTLVNAWIAGFNGWQDNGPNYGGDVLPPSGGLFGTLSIINVAAGTQVSVNATSLEDVYNASQHQNPGNNFPTLRSANPPVSVVMINNGGPAGQDPQVYASNWVPSGPYAGINSVSATIMADAVMNGYSVNPANEAESAWVVTFPTKWAYADQDAIVGGVLPVAPFTDTFQDRVIAGNNDNRATWDNRACEDIQLRAYDREEQTTTGDVDFSPSTTTTNQLCYEVNVIQFDTSTVFDSANTTFTASGLPGTNGWMRLSFIHPNHQMGAVAAESENVESHLYQGLPVIGFKAKVLGNGQLAGAGSYGSAVDHVYDRVITGGGAGVGNGLPQWS